MKKIYKFGPLSAYVGTPYYGRPVHAAVKDELGGEEVYMWCEVESDGSGFPDHEARLISTGLQTYEDDETYVGTAIMHTGLVWHVLSKKTAK